MRPESPGRVTRPSPAPKKPGAPVSSVAMWASWWQITASCGAASAASDSELAAVPEATNRTSASASRSARIRSAARRETWSVP